MERSPYLPAFNSPGGQKGRDVVVMEISAAAGILIQRGEPEARLQLPADLLLQRVGELNPPVVFDGVIVHSLILEGVERQRIEELFLLPVKGVVESGIQSSTPPSFKTRKHSRKIGRTSST